MIEFILVLFVIGVLVANLDVVIVIGASIAYIAIWLVMGLAILGGLGFLVTHGLSLLGFN